jgi:hypothetical protein
LTAPSLSVVKNDVAGATSSEPEIQKQINLRNVTYVEEESDCCLTPNEQFFIYIMSRTAWVRARFCKLQKRVHSTCSRK